MKRNFKSVFVDYIKTFDIAKKINYNRIYYKSNAQKRACHMEEMFINSDGEVYPCCRTWSRPDMKIGDITDDDLDDKIKNFNVKCACKSYRLVKAKKDDVINIDYINLELSLKCQATCAMCIVYAPDFKGTYNLYEKLNELVEKYEPKFMLVQGGEVLAQKESMDWLEGINEKKPDLQISLVTNGSVGIETTKRAEKLYKNILVSFVGFQQETYKKVMGLNIDKTKKFVDTLNKSDNVEMLAKYLCTPINLHEANLFIEWAISVKLKTMILSDSNVSQYVIEDTWDDYWIKIFDRTAKDIKKVLIKNKQYMIDNNIKIYIQDSLLELFHFSDNNIKKLKLEKIIFRDYQRSDSLAFFGS